MKQITLNRSVFTPFLLLMILSFFAIGAFAQSPTAEKTSDETLVIYTESLAEDVIGFNAKVPLKIILKNGIIQSVEALPNEETPSFFQPVKEKLLPIWKGMTINEGINAKVDVISGATYSSRAVIENVKRGLTYAKKISSNTSKMSFARSPYFIVGAVVGVLLALVVIRLLRRKKIAAN